MQHLAQLAGLNQIAQHGNAGSAPVGEADPRHRVSGIGSIDHRPGVDKSVAQRLLAEHVFAGGEQPFDHLPVQAVGHHDAHHLNVRVLRDRPPGRVAALVPEPARRQIDPSSALTSPIDTNRSGGRVDAYSVGATRYAAACARPAIPAPITATPRVIKQPFYRSLVVAFAVSQITRSLQRSPKTRAV